jgi:hypothetical protein
VEFVPVPALSGPRERRPGRGGNHPSQRPRAIPAKGGAGLETDLGDGRHADRLPQELRAALPARGLVNYMEALAVVRALEALAAAAPAGAAPVGVVALYQAQAELLRLLIGRSAALSAGRLPVKVGAPDAFREEEFATLLVSLTRSHSHRAVTYGDGPHLVELALTRGRERLVLFGDPGTLARRAQWDGPVDHLDEAASARERHVVAKLVGYLSGQGRHPETFHFREGGGTS